MRAMQLRSFILALVCTAFGCAGAQHPNTANKDEVATADVDGAPNPDGKMICHMEYDTGSHIPEKVCRYKDESDLSPELPTALQRMNQGAIPPRLPGAR